MAGRTRLLHGSMFEALVDQQEVELADGRFAVVARPGESLGLVEHGDLLVRRPRDGGRPLAVRITSGPATPDDFFCEGVMAERGAPGLYVEVENDGAYGVAHRIADTRGRVPHDRLVLRRIGDGSGETFAEETDAELLKRRTTLLAGVTKDDLYWTRVKLTGGFSVLVSSPIYKDSLFIPVTATETLQLARKFDVFPLSRAVMDQAHNIANQVPRPAPPSSLYDFVTYSQRLNKTLYYSQYGMWLSSGAHKLWVVSSHGPVVNYGFYIPRVRGELVRCGPYLDPKQNVIQGLGAAHNGQHWDYSQLLQFMSGLKDADGQRMDLRQALVDKHPAVWDEPLPPLAATLP